MRHFFTSLNFKFLTVLMLISIGCHLVFFYFAADYTLTPDSFSYIAASQLNYARLEVDSNRPPSYPLLIKFFNSFFTNQQDQLDPYTGLTYSSAALRSVIICQEIIFLLVTIYLFLTLTKLTRRPWLAFFGSLVFACSPIIFNFNFCLLTESLSISGLTFYLCGLARLISFPPAQKSWLWPTGLSVLTFWLICLRPAFQFLLIVNLILTGSYLIATFIKRRTPIFKKYLCTGLIWLAGVLVSLCLISLLARINLQRNNVAAFSGIPSITQLHILILTDLYQFGPDAEIIAVIDQMPHQTQEELWPVSNYLYSVFPHPRIADYVNQTISAQPRRYLTRNLYRAIANSEQPLGMVYATARDLSNQKYLAVGGHLLWPFNFIHLYYLVPLLALFWLWRWWQTKRFPALPLIALIIILGNMGTMIFGGQSEWWRIIVPAMPVVIFSLILVIDQFISRPNSTDQE